MSFETKLRARPKGACDCWDCLRAAGLTPSLAARGKHRSLYSPQDKEMRGLGIDTDGKGAR